MPEAREVGITAARSTFAEIINDTSARGRTTYLTSHGRRVAALIPLAEIERLRKVEAAARVVLDTLKDTRMGPDGEDAYEALFDLVPVTIAEDNDPTTEETK